MSMRRWGSWLATGAAAFLMAACGGGSGGGSTGGTSTGAGTGTGTSASGDTTGSGTTKPLSYMVRLNTNSAQVGLCRSQTLSAIVVDSNGVDVTGASAFTWTSGDTNIASVDASTSSNNTVTGVASGNTTIQVATVVTSADNATHALPVQTVALSVVANCEKSYAITAPNQSLLMTDGQSLPVTVSMVDNNGTDVSAGATWTWTSSDPAVTLTSANNTATLVAHNTSTTDVATANITVSATAPNGGLLTGLIGVSVQKKSTTGDDTTFHVTLSQRGAPITALSVLNGYPQVVNARVLRNDGVDVTADFDGQWIFTPNSTTLAAADSATHDVTITTTRENNTEALQSTLQVRAVSTKLSTSAAGSLLVTQQPAWALVNDNASPLILSQLVPTNVPLTARLRHHGIEVPASECGNWQWTSTSNVLISPTLPALDNQRNVAPAGTTTGDFTVTATCTTVADNTPLQIVFPGKIQ